jgi:serine/threonine-protein kinase
MERDSREPRRIGPYRILRKIGSGGHAVVYEAEDETLGLRVAVKVLYPHVAEQSSAVARFLREGRSLARLRHPHVVQVFSLGEDRGVPYLAMELLAGGSLESRLERTGKLAVSEAIDVLLPVIAAIGAAHGAGILHRDIKTSNIVFAEDQGRPWPKVVDFGLSKMLAVASDRLTTSEKVMGTAAYMAPELIHSVDGASKATDQYALGVTLYRCVTGEMPFAGSSFYELARSVMTAPLRPPSTVVPGLPSELDSVVLRVLDRRASSRFPSVAALGLALVPFAPVESGNWWRKELSALASGNGPDLRLVTSAGMAAGTNDVTEAGDGPKRKSGRVLLAGRGIASAFLATCTIAGALALRGFSVSGSASDPKTTAASESIPPPPAPPRATDAPASESVPEMPIPAVDEAGRIVPPTLEAPSARGLALPTTPTATPAAHRGSLPPPASVFADASALGAALLLRASPALSAVSVPSASPQAPDAGAGAARPPLRFTKNGTPILP